MKEITLEAVKERQDELAVLIAKLEEQWSKPSFFEYQGERIPLNPGETYVGTIIAPGEYGGYHLVLMPDSCESITWQKAMEWADELGGELPNRVEGALLFATQKAEFEEAWYWMRDEHQNNEYAWVQDFLNGGQGNYRKIHGHRARAVRRLVLQ